MSSIAANWCAPLPLSLCRIEHPMTEQVQLNPSEGTALDQFQLVDMPLRGAIRRRQRESGAQGGAISLQACREVA
jgi:hypothetical protein